MWVVVSPLNLSHQTTTTLYSPVTYFTLNDLPSGLSNHVSTLILKRKGWPICTATVSFVIILILFLLILILFLWHSPQQAR